MSRRVWTKPFVKTILSGDQRKARSLERKARSYVGYLFDQMGDRQKHRAGNWNLKDGSKITCYVWRDALGDRALVKIYSVVNKRVFETTTKYILENGLIISDQAPGLFIDRESGSPIIYLSSNNKSYFSGAGTVIPSSTDTKYEHIQGSYIKDSYLDFEDNYLEGLSSYESKLFSLTPEMADMDPVAWSLSGVDVKYGTFNISSMYTGLMRLAVQAKMATSGNLEDLFPWGIGPPGGGTINAYLHDGLIRTSDYEYFAIRTEDNICKACRMTFMEDISNIVEDLANGLFAEDSIDKVEAFILAKLIPKYVVNNGVAVLDEYQLLVADDITPNDEGQPLAYGWKYSYGPEFKSSIIRHKVVFYETHPYTIGDCVEFIPTLSTITFGFSTEIDGKIIPSASITHTKYNAWNMAGHNNPGNLIWRPKELHQFNLDLYLEDWCGNSTAGFDIESPVYCFYTKQDLDLQVVTYTNKLVKETSPYYSPSLTARNSACWAMPLYTVIKDGGVTLYTRGFSINGNGGPIISTESDGEAIYEGDISISSGGDRDYLITTGINPLGTGTIGIPQCNQVSRPIYGYYKQFCDRATVNVKLEYRTLSLPTESGNYITPLSVALIIPRLNAEAAVSLSRKARRANLVYDIPRNPTSTQWYYTTNTFVFYTDNTYTVETGVYTGGMGFQLDGGVYATAGNWSGETGVYTDRWLRGNAVIIDSNVEEREYTFFCKTSNKTIEYSPVENQWDYYFNTGNVEDFISFELPESWGGELIYPTSGTDANSYTIDGYQDSTLITEKRTRRWIGWA